MIINTVLSDTVTLLLSRSIVTSPGTYLRNATDVETGYVVGYLMIILQCRFNANFGGLNIADPPVRMTSVTNTICIYNVKNRSQILFESVCCYIDIRSLKI
ncbi:uncharacterized protein LOC143150993 [Ptiloglossa arizonensis]|uniref:uncharacterized protein LOC143150993 n=1 Tax=Ptiloglossa arizonensis TaxID=3350558 RepID=UPI003F9FF8CA